MRLLLTILIFVLGIKSQAQRFNRSYDFFGVAQVAWAVEKADSSIFVMCTSRDSNGNLLGLRPLIIDSLGNRLDSNQLFIPSSAVAAGWANTTDATTDGGFIMGGGIDDGVDYGFLIKFNAQGDTVWTRRHGVNGFFDTFRQAKQTTDGGYIAVGETNRTNGQATDGWVVKTDSNGVLQWEQFYGSLNVIEAFYSIEETTDGGFIIGGRMRDDRLANNRNYDPIVYKIDSAGNVQWSYWFDTIYDDIAASAIQTYDGNYVFSSSISQTHPSFSKDYAKPALFKLDQSGTLMWSKTYGPLGSNTGLGVVKQLVDSSLIAAGQLGILGPKTLGYLIHTDQNGDSIFVESYENVSGNNNNRNYLFDVIPMNNGGFMACGEVIGLPPAVPFRQDAWVIRVDSNGCILANCLVGNQSIEYREASIEIYPNPTNGLLILESTMPLSRIVVYNLQGQKVMEVGPAESQFELPQESGLYLVRLTTQDGEVVNKKVIKR